MRNKDLPAIERDALEAVTGGTFGKLFAALFGLNCSTTPQPQQPQQPQQQPPTQQPPTQQPPTQQPPALYAQPPRATVEVATGDVGLAAMQRAMQGGSYQ